MKNIHILPTDKPSRILFDKEDNEYLNIQENPVFMDNQDLIDNREIYITSDEEIKDGDWCYDEERKLVFQFNSPTGLKLYKESSQNFLSKVILTTDQNLIKDGVQAIDDEFLEWFVNNPSYEKVKLEHIGYVNAYKIIMPKEEESIIKDLNYYKLNAEEDYMTTPISVLKYITELEKRNLKK